VSLVLDASVTLAWLYPDETTDAVRDVFDIVVNEGGIVPALWRLEVANGLTHALRRGRITSAFRNAALADLALAPIAIDGETDVHAWAATLHLADRFGLTLYDAAYLELAQRRALPLASLDGDLRATARQLGVPLAGA
jgi:predicted nucleic acid-binding protein